MLHSQRAFCRDPKKIRARDQQSRGSCVCDDVIGAPPEHALPDCHASALLLVADALLALKQQYPIALAAEGATRITAMEQAIAVARRMLATGQKVNGHA